MEKTIYKKDSKGKVRYLTISTSHGILSQESGVLGTANPIIHEKECKPKNVGRSNETTAEEQAISEAISKVKEKLRKGYFENIDDAEEKGGSDFMAPMLAHKYEDYADKIEFPCYVQPKLDGIRMFDTPDGKVSRTNKPILTMDHINVRATLLSFIEGTPFGIITQDPVVDGELYAHGLNFQENTRLIKKYREGETEQVKYHIYDIVSDEPFSKRTKWAEDIAKESENCEIVPTYKVENMTQVKKWHAQFLSEGYEGTMIRWSDNGYDVNKRSKYLLKYKDFIDEKYKVVDVIPFAARPEQGTLVCENADGVRFKTGMKFSHAEREDMLNNRHMYIGKMAEVRFFEFSESGIPRFPVCVGFRID